MKKILIIPFLIGLFGCSTLKVVTNYDKNTDFSNYKTFRIHEGKMIPGDELGSFPVVRQKAIAIAIEELQKKGFKFVKGDEADFVVALHAGHKDRMNDTRWNDYDFYDPWKGENSGRIVVNTSDKMAFVFDFVDPKNRKLIWRAIGKGPIEPGTGMDNEKIRDLIVEILEDFPPE